MNLHIQKQIDLAKAKKKWFVEIVWRHNINVFRKINVTFSTVVK